MLVPVRLSICQNNWFYIKKSTKGVFRCYKRGISARFELHLTPRPILSASPCMESTSTWLPMSERYMKVRTGRHWTPGDHISDMTCKKSRKKSSKLSFSGTKVLIKSHLLHIFWGFEECSKGTFLIFENFGQIYRLKIWLENIRNSAKKI